MRLVLANGVFDILHYGHILHLRQARAMGDMLLVALTADSAVNKGPGRPMYSWPERAAVLRELRCVSGVVQSHSAVASILAIKPHIFVKGIDYAYGDRFTEDVFACVEVEASIRYTDTQKMSVDDAIRRAIEARSGEHSGV